MKKIYKCYPTWWFYPTLENFWETSFYTTWKYYDYVCRKKTFKNAEVLILWDPVELENWKFIPNRYFWKIKNMWIVKFKYLPSTDEIVIFDFEKILRWNPLSEEEESRLKKCLHKQCFYQSNQNVWSTGACHIYIEVYKPILKEVDCLLKQKYLYDLPFCFDEKWKIFDNKIKLKRFFKLYTDVYYDLKKKVFIKNGEEILFSSYNSEKKQNFLEILIENNSSKISKEYLCDKLKLNNKKLLEIKRSLLVLEFEKYLWIDKDFVQKNILIAEKNKGYIIYWEFLEKIS